MEENGLSTKWNLQQTRLLCWGKLSSYRQHCWLKRWTHLLSWILQCFSFFILLKQTCLKDTMKILWKSDWTHVNCALKHQWCKCAYLYFENLTVQPYHAYFKSWPSSSSGLFPGAVSSGARVWLPTQRAVLRQGLALSHRAPRNKTFSEVLPHRWVIETVCGNTNLSPWWRKPLLIHCILLSV